MQICSWESWNTRRETHPSKCRYSCAKREEDMPWGQEWCAIAFSLYLSEITPLFFVLSKRETCFLIDYISSWEGELLFFSECISLSSRNQSIVLLSLFSILIVSRTMDAYAMHVKYSPKSPIYSAQVLPQKWFEITLFLWN